MIVARNTLRVYRFGWVPIRNQNLPIGQDESRRANRLTCIEEERG